MTRALLFECHAGISGDMTLAALIDLGVPEAHLRKELGKLSLDHEFEIEVARAVKMGITGTQVHVRQTATKEHVVDGHEHNSGQDHHHHHNHNHTHSHGHEHDHHEAARTYNEIKHLIVSAAYAPGVRDRALDMFSLVAEAEAKIHGMSVDQVHFHEVGAIDSIVDIVGVAIALEYLEVDTILCGPVELGAGRVHCAHGEFPVPAPATSEILIGVPTQSGGLQGEATTPTGAAILKSNVDRFGSLGQFTAERIGYGVGHKDFSVPNVLRVTLGDCEQDSAVDLPASANYEIITNIDDMSAEGFQPMLERLFEAGASDAFLTPIVMKKGRLAQSVTVLCKAENLEALAELLMTESSSIGVRIKPIWKRMLDREFMRIETSLGPVSVKVVSLPDGGQRWKVEHDDVVAIAKERDESYSRVKAIIEQEVYAELAPEPLHYD